MGHYVSACSRNTFVERWRRNGNESEPTTTGATFMITDGDSKPEGISEEESSDDEQMFLFNMIYKSIKTAKKHIINSMWMLLDSTSAVNIFSNRKM